MIQQKRQNLSCVFFFILAHLLWSGCGKNVKTKDSSESKSEQNSGSLDVKAADKSGVSEEDKKKEKSILDDYYKKASSKKAGDATTKNSAGAQDKAAGEDLDCFFGTSYPSSPEVLDSVQVQFKPVDSFSNNLKLVVKGREVNVSIEPTKADVFLWKNTWPSGSAQTVKQGDPHQKRPAAAYKWSVSSGLAISSTGLTLSKSELSSSGVKVADVADISFAWKLKLTSSEDLFHRVTNQQSTVYETSGSGNSKYIEDWFSHFFKAVHVVLNGKPIPYVLLAQRFYSNKWTIKTDHKKKKEIYITIEHMWTENWTEASGAAQPVEQSEVVLKSQWDEHKKHCDRVGGS